VFPTFVAAATMGLLLASMGTMTFCANCCITRPNILNMVVLVVVTMFELVVSHHAVADCIVRGVGSDGGGDLRQLLCVATEYTCSRGYQG
jgi:hypothetical protein